MTKILRVTSLIILTLALIITGCQPRSERAEETSPTTPEETSSTTAEETEPITAPEGTQVGNLAPDFELQELDGKTISLRGLRGKPVLLNFWATWCHWCRVEMPFLEELYEEWSENGLVMLAIDVGESASTVERFLESNNVSLLVLLDASAVVAKKYNIRGYPTTYFVDKDGIIQGIKIGAFLDKESLEEYRRKIIS